VDDVVVAPGGTVISLFATSNTVPLNGEIVWTRYYTPAHMETILRRAAATGISFGSLLGLLLECSTFVAVENTHPMQGGVFRMKYRRDRHSGIPLEAAWRFYPKYLWEIASKHVKLGRRALFLHGLRRAPSARKLLTGPTTS
jgi:hypothetical protein